MIGTESPVKIYGLDKDPNYSAVCHLCANKLNIMLVYNWKECFILDHEMYVYSNMVEREREKKDNMDVMALS